MAQISYRAVMPKKKDPPLSAAEQRCRFEVLASTTGAGPSGKQFKNILERVAKANKAPAKGGPRGSTKGPRG